MPAPLTFRFDDGRCSRQFEAGSAVELFILGLDAFAEWCEPSQGLGQHRHHRFFGIDIKAESVGWPSVMPWRMLFHGPFRTVTEFSEYLDEHAVEIWERAVIYSNRDGPIGSAEPSGPAPF